MTKATEESAEPEAVPPSLVVALGASDSLTEQLESIRLHSELRSMLCPDLELNGVTRVQSYLDLDSGTTMDVSMDREILQIFSNPEPYSDVIDEFIDYKRDG
jgi:hypothetical protein